MMHRQELTAYPTAQARNHRSLSIETPNLRERSYQPPVSIFRRTKEHGKHHGGDDIPVHDESILGERCFCLPDKPMLIRQRHDVVIQQHHCPCGCSPPSQDMYVRIHSSASRISSACAVGRTCEITAGRSIPDALNNLFSRN